MKGMVRAMDNSIAQVLKETMEKIKTMINAQMVVGEPISVPDGVTLIPVSRAVFGFATGGTDYDGKKAQPQKNFGGGAGAGVKVEPVAFLVIKGESVRIINLAGNETLGAIERAADLAPEMVEKIVGIFKKDKPAE